MKHFMLINFLSNIAKNRTRSAVTKYSGDGLKILRISVTGSNEFYIYSDKSAHSEKYFGKDTYIKTH